MSKIKVVIIDDQRLVREGIASLLEIQSGLEITGTASDGKEGVELSLKQEPDVVLMDIRMPIQDGITSVELLYKNGFKGKVIMLTTFDDEEYIIKSLKAGAVGYLMKDIPAEDLGRAIQQAHNNVFQFNENVMGSLIGYIDKSTNTSENIPTITDFQKEMISKLSHREKEVFIAIGQGFTNNEIADELNLSEGTIKNYVSSIFNALGLRDRVQAALVASRYNEKEAE